MVGLVTSITSLDIVTSCTSIMVTQYCYMYIVIMTLSPLPTHRYTRHSIACQHLTHYTGH